MATQLISVNEIIKDPKQRQGFVRFKQEHGQPQLDDLWFFVGSRCNLQCKHCYVASSPTNDLLQQMTVEDIKPFLEEAKGFGVKDIYFTGGEPFINEQIMQMIVLSLQYGNVTILTNATLPITRFIPQLKELQKRSTNTLSLRISIDHYKAKQHNAIRGEGMFQNTLRNAKLLSDAGFKPIITATAVVYEHNPGNLTPDQIKQEFQNVFAENGVDVDVKLLPFNLEMGANIDRMKQQGKQQAPYVRISEDCMSRVPIENFQCHNGRTIEKINGKMVVYPCPIIYNNPQFELATNLHDSFKDVHVTHKACFDFCYKAGGTCTNHEVTSTGKVSVQDGEQKSNDQLKDDVKEYYGQVLETKKDLKTNACCSAEILPPHQMEVFSKIANEVKEKFYGCGSPIPLELEGKTVLDLGCGTGRDVFMVSALVGESGKVFGVDMTGEQLAVANKYKDEQAQRFGHTQSNVEFKKGYIEDLQTLGIPDNSVDIVISNCVINLSPNKEKVFAEIFRVLKPGGELHFSDIFADRRIPENLKNDPVIRGECLGGALYIEDFRRLMLKLGYPDYRILKKGPITIQNNEIQQKTGLINFSTLTVRVFKLASMEDICEDYGQTATYLGTIPESPDVFMLDDHHLFIKDKPMLVCGNSAAMLQETRFAKHFLITGDRSKHFGPFDCSPGSGETARLCCNPSAEPKDKSGGCC